MSYYTSIYPPKFVLLDCAIIYPFRYRLVARFPDVDLGTVNSSRGLVPSGQTGASLNFGTQIHPPVVIAARRGAYKRRDGHAIFQYGWTYCGLIHP